MAKCFDNKLGCYSRICWLCHNIFFLNAAKCFDNKKECYSLFCQCWHLLFVHNLKMWLNVFITKIACYSGICWLCHNIYFFQMRLNVLITKRMLFIILPVLGSAGCVTRCKSDAKLAVRVSTLLVSQPTIGGLHQYWRITTILVDFNNIGGFQQY